MQVKFMIRKFAQSAVVLAAVISASLPAPPTLAQSTARVQFQPGSDNIALSGTITGQEYFDYVLRARAGQRMSVALIINGTNGNGSAFFNILPPGSTGEAIFNGSTSPDRYGEVSLPEDGDYTIRVYLMGNDRDTDRTVGYTVSATITGDSVTPDESDDVAWFARLPGASEEGAATQMRLHGFELVDIFGSGRDGHGTIWYNGAIRQCLQMIVVNGRVDSTVDIGQHSRCHS